MNSVISKLPQRFVCVKLNSAGSKQSYDPRTGYNLKWLDPSTWMTYSDAISFNPPFIGFVLLESDPLFGIDLDDCALPDGSGWNAEAMRICGDFPGAAVEISSSGRGLHIIASCPRKFMLPLGDAKNHHWTTPAGQKVEVFTGNKVVTLGRFGDSLQGEPLTDHTVALARLLMTCPARPVLAAASAPAAVCPVDDETVLARMLAARGGAAAAFGDGPTPADLWHAKADVLARHYQTSTPGQQFDHSEAVLAFMNHAAFWTGRDPNAMDRIFRQSPLFLARGDGGEKWIRHPTHRNDTISKAMDTPNVYDWSRSAATSDLGEYLTLPEQQEHFKGCVYVVEPHRVLTPDHGLLAPEQFNAVYGGHRFVVSTGENSGTTKKAFEAFTENRGVRFPKAKRTGIHPDRPFGEIVGDEVNIYRAPPAPTPGDVTPFLAHLARLVPDATDRQSLLLWLAHVVQRPGKLTRWAPVLVGTPGNGKSFIGACVARAIGEQYRHMVRPGELSATHNGWITGKLFAQVEEIDLFTRRETIETLKPWITDPAINVRAMRTDSVTIPNRLNWLFCTNHEGGVPKSVNDRRFMILHTAQQSAADNARDGLTSAYFDRLWSWAETGGFEHVAAYLAGHALVGFPGTAPDTSSTADAIAASRGPIEQAIADAIEERRMGFRGGWISGGAVTRLFEEMREKRPGPRALRPALAALGYLYAGRSSRVIMTDGEGEPRLYRHGLSKPADREARIAPDEYMAAQGMTTTVGVPPSIIQFPGKA